MPEARIEFSDEEQYNDLKRIKERHGLTWKGLVLQGAAKAEDDAVTLKDGEITLDKDEMLYLRTLAGEEKMHPRAIADVVNQVDSNEHSSDTIQKQLEYLSDATDYVETVGNKGEFRLTRSGEIEVNKPR